VLLGAYLLETLFERTRIPDQLFLIAAGLLFGHVLGWGQRSGLESADRLFTEAALLVILFHGGSALDLGELVRGLGAAVALTLVSFVSSIAIIMLIAHFGLGQSWLIAALLGATLSGTGPTVIVPMVRALKLGERVSAVLTVESGLSDVLCIVVALALLSALELGHLRVGATAAHAVVELAATIALGAATAALWVLVRAQLERHVRKDHLGTIAVLFGTVGAADWLGLSGPMAALVFGLVLANVQGIPGLARLARGPAISDLVVVDAATRRHHRRRAGPQGHGGGGAGARARAKWRAQRGAAGQHRAHHRRAVDRVRGDPGLPARSRRRRQAVRRPLRPLRARFAAGSGRADPARDRGARARRARRRAATARPDLAAPIRAWRFGYGSSLAVAGRTSANSAPPRRSRSSTARSRAACFCCCTRSLRHFFCCS
jgi:hypothetical protein